MLTANSLKPPKTGRSRFSKALPAVPGLDRNDIDDYDYYSPPTSPPKQLPDLPPPPPPPPPPPRSDSRPNAKPLDAALPALPLSTLANVNAPPSGPPTMSIPRRPVGKPLALPRQPQNTLTVSLPDSAVEPASPAYSISSLLSAYSRSSGESLVRSSEPSTSARESEITTSPNDANDANDEVGRESYRPEPPMASYTGIKANELPQSQNVAPNPIMNDAAPPPPPLPKDDRQYLPSSPAPPPPIAKQDSAHRIESPSPPRPPQIWRRRSLKAERGLELPDLKLATTNGSTAATTQLSAQSTTQTPALSVTQPTTQSQPPPGAAVTVAPLPLQPPRLVGGLPGRNIRPAPPVPAKTQPAETQAMGNGTSKLKNIKNKLHAFHRKDGSGDTTSETSARPGAQRPPTPEYQKEDVKTPIIDTFVSPVSPASSPEPPAEVSPVLPKELPRVPSTDAASIESGTVSRKALPVSPRSSLTPSVDSTTARAVPELKVVTQIPPATEPFPDIVLSSGGNRASGGSDAASTSSRTYQPYQPYQPYQSAESATSATSATTKFPPRHSSKASLRSIGPRAIEQTRQSNPELDPRLVHSESQGYLYRGRDGTLYPEMRELKEPDSRAFYFPTPSIEPIQEGTIIRAPPLKDSHYNCYHKHKTMNRRTNRFYPLMCQTCVKADDEDRWSCTFCHLRVCESCLKALNGHQRDLRLLVDDLSQRP